VKLALGTAQFGLPYGIANQTGQVSLEEASAILRLAHAHGIRTLDTAVAYGDSEQRLGDAGLNVWQDTWRDGGQKEYRNGWQDAWKIVSKLPEIPAGVRVDNWVCDCVGRSLERLRVPTLYGLLLHRPLQLLEAGGDRLYAALQRLKDLGLAHRVGVSVYDPSELDLLSRFSFDLVQAPLSIADRRLIESGWLARLAGRGTEVHVRSVFLQGLLVMPPSARPSKFARWSSLLRAYDSWLERTGATPVQACLRYALSVPEVSRVIVGVESAEQLQGLIDAAAGPSLPVPQQLQSTDGDLLNPARWAAL
jgi:aryl-alcohol dehydrogenase-like predicted oxidoreductase